MELPQLRVSKKKGRSLPIKLPISTIQNSFIIILKIMIKFTVISYRKAFPSIFGRTALSKFSSLTYCIKEENRVHYICEKRDEIINECMAMLRGQFRLPDTFENNFSFYREYGYCHQEREGLKRFLSHIKEIKPVALDMKALIEDDKVCKITSTSSFSLMKRMNINPHNLVYIDIVKMVSGGSKGFFNSGYRWIRDIYLPVIDHLKEESLTLSEAYFTIATDIVSLQSLFIGSDSSGKLHPEWSIGQTGRLYARNPALQTIPSHLLAEIFAPERYRLFTYDFPHFEVSILAYFTGCEELIACIKKGNDIYTHIQKKTGATDRKTAKLHFLKSIYSKGETPFVEINRWKALMRENREEYILLPMQRYAKVEREEQRYNYPIQSLGADISAYVCYLLIQKGYRVRLNRHDGFIVESEKPFRIPDVGFLMNELFYYQ